MTRDLAALRTALAQAAPLVQNITNTVVQQFTANVLLAVGAAPAMIDHEADAAQFARLADALLVNLGTATSHQLLATDAATTSMRAQGKPWVLDPVSIGVADYRSSRICQALAAGPSAVRGNASEIAALAGGDAVPRGVDATVAVERVLPQAIALAQDHHAVIAISGPQDAIVEVAGQTVRIAYVDGGHALMPRVIGTGCALGALTAAYLAAARRSTREGTPVSDFDAVLAAHVHFKLAGARAGQHATGPGSFAVAFLDALDGLPADELNQAPVRLRVRELPDHCAF